MTLLQTETVAGEMEKMLQLEGKFQDASESSCWPRHPCVGMGGGRSTGDWGEGREGNERS